MRKMGSICLAERFVFSLFRPAVNSFQLLCAVVADKLTETGYFSQHGAISGFRKGYPAA